VAYEQKGIDYPIGYVRWTETRNMEAFLKLVADRKLDLPSLITHRFPIARAHSAYDLITGKTQEAFLGVLLSYPDDAQDTQLIDIASSDSSVGSQKSIRVGLLGAGSFAVSTMLPLSSEFTALKWSSQAPRTDRTRGTRLTSSDSVPALPMNRKF